MPVAKKIKPQTQAKIQNFLKNFNANKQKFNAARDQVQRFKNPPKNITPVAKPPAVKKTVAPPKAPQKKVMAPKTVKPVEVILPPPPPAKAPAPVKNTIRVFGKEYEPAAVWTLGTLAGLATLYGGYKLLSR